MDKPADPATPFGEVYQSFFDDLALEGTKNPTVMFRRGVEHGIPIRGRASPPQNA
jgi:hypothetical protein